MKHKGLSLFANVGVAELLLKKTNFDVVVANELLPQRVRFYRHTHRNVDMIEGDITSPRVYKDVISSAKEAKVDFVMATPPCQGMSSAGMQDPFDPRNQLITYAIDAILDLKPKYVFLENVPQQLRTKIKYKGKEILVPEFIKQKLGKLYSFDHEGVFKMEEYGIPQTRSRSIFLLSRKDIKEKWNEPKKEDVKTMRDVIGHLPPLNPVVKEVEWKDYFGDQTKSHKAALKIHPWHKPPVHSIRHIKPMEFACEGKSAFLNSEENKPKLKNGRTSKGFKNTYKRQWWDRPAYTITMYNGVLGSQENGHPGRELKNGKMSDPRVLTVYEIMLMSTIPEDWDLPEWASENLIRHVIGEAIPPLMVKKLFEGIK